MHPRTLALIFAAGIIGAGCANKEAKPEATPAAAAAPAPEAAPIASKPECPPEPSAKVKSTKSKNKKRATPVVVDCEPAKPKDAATTTKASPTTAAAAPAVAAPAKEPAKAAEAGKPRMMKSVDGTFEGEVYGNIPSNSKWAKIQIGMEQPEIERILGVSHLVTAYPTAKAFIPFYYGTDRTRYEVRYPGQGSVSYTGGSWGGGQGVVMMINYDPTIK